MLVGADRCLGDIVSEMLSTIEDTGEPHEEAHIYLCTLFPQFSHIFSEIKEVRLVDEDWLSFCPAAVAACEGNRTGDMAHGCCVLCCVLRATCCVESAFFLL